MRCSEDDGTFLEEEEELGLGVGRDDFLRLEDTGTFLLPLRHDSVPPSESVSWDDAQFLERVIRWG